MGTRHGRLYRLTERFYDAWLKAYERTLAAVMRHRPATLVFSIVILVATGWLFRATPKGLLPADDTGQLLATTEAAEGASFDGAGGGAEGHRGDDREGSRRAVGDVDGRDVGGGQSGAV